MLVRPLYVLCFLILLLPLLCHSFFNENDSQRVSLGLQSANSLMKQTPGKNFKGDYMKVAKLAGKIFLQVVTMVMQYLQEQEYERRHQQLFQLLQDVDNKLDVLRHVIERKFDEVKQQIELDSIASEVDELNAVKDQYEQWIKYANDTTNIRKERFQQTCSNKNIATKPGFFRRVFVSHGEIRRPRQSVVQLNHRKLYYKFASSIIGYFLYSIYLNGFCAGLNGITPDLEKTLQQDAKIYEEYMKEMYSVIESDSALIESRFWQNAIADMDKYLSWHTSSSHETFANALFNHLTDKYDYREWLVISYGDATFYGVRDHDCYPTDGEQIYNTSSRSTFFYNAVARKYRNVILASPNNIRAPFAYYDFYPSSVDCIDKGSDCLKDNFDKKPSTRDAVDCMKACNIYPKSLNPIIKFVFVNTKGYAVRSNSLMDTVHEIRLTHTRVWKDLIDLIFGTENKIVTHYDYVYCLIA